MGRKAKLGGPNNLICGVRSSGSGSHFRPFVLLVFGGKSQARLPVSLGRKEHLSGGVEAYTGPAVEQSEWE